MFVPPARFGDYCRPRRTHCSPVPDESERRRRLTSYRGLRVWQVAMDLVVESYEVGELLPIRERYGEISQIRRAATSIPSNIAEGYGRARRGEYLNQLSNARGSLFELETHFAIAERLRYASAHDAGRAFRLCDLVSRQLTRLRQSLGD